MAKGSSDSSSAVKKVARAAETAGQRDLSMRARLGFPSLVGLICVLGVALVVFARLTRDAEATPVQNRDHWHAVYGIYDCDAQGNYAYLPPFQSQNDPEGIHSHQDGIMHIHPFFDSSDGPDATVEVFLEAMGAEATDTSLTLPPESPFNGAELGANCPDSDAVFHMRKWQFDFLVDSQDPDIITEGFDQVQYLNDREVYILAYAPLDAEIPLPPADRFDQLDAVAGAITSTGPTLLDDLAEPTVSFEVEGPTGDSEADADADADAEDNADDGG